MPAYLICGQSGSGKSTLTKELIRRGKLALDADYDERLAMYRHAKTGVTKQYLAPEDIHKDGEYTWCWDKRRLQQILDEHRVETLFILGNSADIHEYYHYFDSVFSLVLDDKTLGQRLQKRSYGFGKKPEELADVLRWNKDYADFQGARGVVLIDATQPIDKTADDILERCYDNTYIPS